VGDHAYAPGVTGLITLAAEAPVPNLDAGSLVLVLAAASGGAILSRLNTRILLPTVVIEILLGILIGPEGLGWAKIDTHIDFLANFGLVFLFFFAGIELVEHRVARRSLLRGTAGWAISIALGIAIGYTLNGAGLHAEGWLLGVALSTTALGTLVPILADARLLSTTLGSAVLGSGVAGEFWPILVVSIFLTGAYGALFETLLLLVFGAIVLLAAAAALRARPPRVVRVLQQTVHTTSQAAVRLSVFTLAALVFVSVEAGFDFVLGAFAGGLVVGLALSSPEAIPVRMRLEGVGYGFLVPIYFVVTGMNFDLDSLLTPEGIGLAVIFLGLFLVVRGVPALLWLRDLAPRETLSLAVYSATGLPLIVAIVGIGIERGAIGRDVGTSLIGAGMISVLVLPLIATALAQRESSPLDDARSESPA
jgi:Kef-type K+ transport system membrane component KefB